MSDTTAVLPLSLELAAWLEEQAIPASLYGTESREPTLADVQVALSEIPSLRVSFHTSPLGLTAFQLSGEPPEQEWAELVVSEGGSGVYFTHGTRSVITAAVGHLARRCGPLALVHASGERPSIISATPTTIDVVGGWAEDLLRGVPGAS
jgi:hypothetical protein